MSRARLRIGRGTVGRTARDIIAVRIVSDGNDRRRWVAWCVGRCVRRIALRRARFGLNVFHSQTAELGIGTGAGPATLGLNDSSVSAFAFGRFDDGRSKRVFNIAVVVVIVFEGSVIDFDLLALNNKCNGIRVASLAWLLRQFESRIRSKADGITDIGTAASMSFSCELNLRCFGTIVVIQDRRSRIDGCK